MGADRQPGPEELETWLRMAGQVLDLGQPELQGDTFLLKRIRGGGNNALFRCSSADGEYALKLCVADERRRAYREYQSLTLLASAGLDLAPAPVWLDETCRLAPYPTVVYKWLEGSPPDFTRLLVNQLAQHVRSLHQLHPGDWSVKKLPNAIFHHFTLDWYQDEQRQLLADYTPWLAAQGQSGSELAARMEALVDACWEVVNKSKVDPQLENKMMGLCRLDYNRTNAILNQDGELRWVDWEYSGWGDPALELADLRWHASLDDLDPELHAHLRNAYQPSVRDEQFYARLAVWDRVVLARWPLLVTRLMWTRVNGPDRPRLSQTEESFHSLWARLERMVARAEIEFQI